MVLISFTHRSRCQMIQSHHAWEFICVRLDSLYWGCLHLYGNTLHPYPLRGSYVYVVQDRGQSLPSEEWHHGFWHVCYYWCLIRLIRFSIYVMYWRGMIVYLYGHYLGGNTSDYGLNVSPTRQSRSLDSTEWNELHQPKTVSSAWSVRCWRRALHVKMEYGVNRSWWEWAFTSRRCNFAWYYLWKLLIP